MVTTTVSQDEAEQIALATVDGTVVETRLDEDNGRPVWNVHLATANGTVEVKVDAETGAARIDDDDDAEDADEDGDDDHGRHGDDGVTMATTVAVGTTGTTTATTTPAATEPH
jgi:hypothetical protein